MLDRFHELCYKIEGFCSECIASYPEAVNLNWWLKVAVPTDIGGMLNGDIMCRESKRLQKLLV